MARQDSDHLWGFGLRRTSARSGSEIESKCLILISNLELMLKPAATAGFSSIGTTGLEGRSLFSATWSGFLALSARNVNFVNGQTESNSRKLYVIKTHGNSPELLQNNNPGLQNKVLKRNSVNSGLRTLFIGETIRKCEL